MQTNAVASSSRLASDSDEATTSSLVLSTLGAYSDLTKQLFALIENPSLPKAKSIADTSAGKTWTVNHVNDVLSALQDVDELFSSRIQIAHRHAINQVRIEGLQAEARRRDKQTRQAILELSQIQSELAEIARLSEEEVASIERAEKQPIGHATLLAYAQRLARYTSAPPGYRLPQLSSITDSKAAESFKSEDGQEADGQPAISLGADYNQYAKRAAAYYDPAIPSMPQEMPFPSDAMMRQGILNSQEMLNGAPMAEQPADDMDEQDDGPGTDFATSFGHLRDQQHRPDDDEDAFDLDLN